MSDHCWNVARDGHQLDCRPEDRETEAWLLWQTAIADEAFRAALDEGLADLKAGRVAPFDDAPAENPA